MKVAVSSRGKDLDSQADPRYGRCANFVLVDTDDIKIEVFDNKSNSLVGIGVAFQYVLGHHVIPADPGSSPGGIQ